MTPVDTTAAKTLIADDLIAVADRLRRSTVQVRSHRRGGGSGVIWRSDGLIITNAHVLRGSKASVELFDGQVLDATVVAKDLKWDLAALSVDAVDLPAAAIADSSALRVGELVLAVGNPLGLIGALTTGIIHAVDTSDKGNWIKADVRLSPGNSGGPLANAQGRVIGINSMIVEGMAIAIPSNTVERFLKQRGTHPQLGVTLQPVLLTLDNSQTLGLVVLAVADDSLAQENGLSIGDVLIGVNGERLSDPNALSNIVSNAEFGDVLQLEFLRGGHHQSQNITLHDRTTSSYSNQGVG